MEISHSGTEFVPHVRQHITRDMDGTCAIHNGPVQLLSAAIVGGSVRSCKEVKNTEFSTEIMNLGGGKFSVISNETF